MDGLQAAIGSLGIVALMLLLVLAICRRLGPRASAWVHSEPEETVGLSKHQLFHANGYMIHQSGSDILLSSTGSFKRFESIDRECVKMPAAFMPKPAAIKSKLSMEASAESTAVAAVSTVWTATTITAPALVSSSAAALTDAPAATVGAAVAVIPPQPLRPAPAPAPSTIQRRRSERALRQHSNDSARSTVNLASTAIPRPLAHRQFSSPTPTAKLSDNNQQTAIQLPINPSDASRAALIALRNSTNPFLIDSIANGVANNNHQKCTGNATLEVQPTACIRFDEIDEQFTCAKTHLGPAAMAPDVRASVRSWLENELASNQINQDKSQNNPFMPLNSRSSVEHIFADTSASRRSSVDRRFDDNFLDDIPKSTEPPTAIVAPAQIHHPKRVFRSRSRSAAEIVADPEHLPYDLQAANPHRSDRRMSSTIGGPNTVSTNPFRLASAQNSATCPPLHKTLSETYLGQWDALTSGGRAAARQYRSSSQQWQLGKQLLQRQYSSLGLMRSLIGTTNGGYSSSNGSQSSLISQNGGDMAAAAGPMQRAQSCESVSSDSSVQLADLQKLPQLVTGQLCVALHVERSTSCNSDIDPAPLELCVTVLQAKELRAPQHLAEFGFELNTFVRLYLVPDAAEAAQTRLATADGTTATSYQEEFRFAMRSQPQSPRRRSLWFHLYHSCATIGGGGSDQNTLIGEVELPLTDPMLAIGRRPTIAWLRLADTKRQRSECGDLLFSISYLPTAERLTVVVVKARNLRVGGQKQALAEEGGANGLQNVFVKVYLLKDKKKVSKKKTSAKRLDNCAIYNESMIFSVPPYMMHSVQVRLTIMHVSREQSSSSSSPPPPPGGMAAGSPAAGGHQWHSEAAATAVGHVIVGDTAGGRGMRHWKEMLSTLRKPIAMWHPIRQTRLAANDASS